MKRKLFLLITLVFLTAASGRQEPLVIGWSGPLTGNCAVVGVDSAAAVQLLVDRVNTAGGINGRKVRLVVEDDTYITTRAVTAYRKLVHQDRALVILANTYGGVFATAKDAVRDQVLIIDPLDCNEDLAALPENSLCLATKTESISAAFSSHILTSSASAVLLMVEESDGWMQLIARETRGILERGGIRVMEESFPASTTSYKSTLVRAKHSGVSAVVILGNDQMGAALKEMKVLNFRAQVYGVGSILSPGFQALAGDSIEGSLVSSWLAPRSAGYETFIKNFKDKYHRTPALELATFPSYDAASLVIHCLKEITRKNSEVNADLLRECLLNIRDFEGLTGRINFDPDGAVRSIHEKLYRYTNGRLEKL